MTILPQLERDLSRAADERLPVPVESEGSVAKHENGERRPLSSRARLGRAVRTTTSSLPAAVSTLLAIVIAVVAISALKAGHSTAPLTRPYAAASPRTELIRTLAVLRRPQTDPALVSQLENNSGPFRLSHRPAARRNPQLLKALARWGNPQPDRRLLRVVTVPSLHAEVLIAPTTYQPSTASRRRSEGITIGVHSPGNIWTGTGPKPTAVSSLLAHGLSLVFGPYDGRDPGVVLVPDGVARIALGPAQPMRFQTPYRTTSKAIADATATLHGTAEVDDNIAAFNFAIPTIVSSQTFSGLYGLDATAPATWYSASGAIIRHTTTEVDLLVRIRGRASPVSARRIALASAAWNNIERDVMCVACHKPLRRANTPPARAERAYISSLIAKRETTAQIENMLVRQYGPAVLIKNRTAGRSSQP
jgi:hypothetical protein